MSTLFLSCRCECGCDMKTMRIYGNTVFYLLYIITMKAKPAPCVRSGSYVLEKRPGFFNQGSYRSCLRLLCMAQQFDSIQGGKKKMKPQEQYGAAATAVTTACRIGDRCARWTNCRRLLGSMAGRVLMTRLKWWQSQVRDLHSRLHFVVCVFVDVEVLVIVVKLATYGHLVASVVAVAALEILAEIV
ncbi:hypothetical protein KCV06_g484, partial [Aureobasidium melanogenum]